MYNAQCLITALVFTHFFDETVIAFDDVVAGCCLGEGDNGG